MIEGEFKIDAAKLPFLERLKNIMDEKYKDPTDSSVQPIHMDININKDFSDDEDDLEIIFVDDDVE